MIAVRKIAVALGAAAAILGASAPAMASQAAPAAKASVLTVFDQIQDRNGQAIVGYGSGHHVLMQGNPGTTWEWNNEGGTSCNGATCWQVADENDGLCMAAVAVSGEWVVEEQSCQPSSDRYQAWSSPGGNIAAPGYIENLGATVANIDGPGEKWFAVAGGGGGSNVYVEDNTNRFSPNFTQWFLG
jgi:hypothetical protein